jgi:flavodoxin
VVAAESRFRVIYLPKGDSRREPSQNLEEERKVYYRRGDGPNVENRVIVAYYSRTGHTRALALEVIRRLKESAVDVDSKELEPVNEFSFIKVGHRTLTHSGEPVKNGNIDLASANLLIIGTPVWMGVPAPYIRSFIEEATDLHGMPVLLFATCSHRDGKAASELRELVRGQGGRPFDYHVLISNSALKMLPQKDNGRSIEGA